jgi:hypothetical protein
MLFNPEGDVKAADFGAAQNVIVNSTGRAAVSVIGRSRLRIGCVTSQAGSSFGREVVIGAEELLQM